MIIIIDGYNLLKSVFHKVKGRLDAQRRQLVKELGFYKKQKPDIKEIVLVFDAGPFGHATREIHSGIVVVFSGQKSNADKWIMDYVERHREKEMLVVTRDREVIKRCQKYGADSFDVDDFYEIVQNTLLEDVAVDIQKKENDDAIHKYKREENNTHRISSEALNLLMEQAAVEGYRKEDIYKDEDERKKRKARMPSKEEKRLSKKLKKL